MIPEALSFNDHDFSFPVYLHLDTSRNALHGWSRTHCRVQTRRGPNGAKDYLSDPVNAEGAYMPLLLNERPHHLLIPVIKVPSNHGQRLRMCSVPVRRQLLRSAHFILIFLFSILLL
jgi:hypothetical protein